MEPAEAALLEHAKTWARECGIGEMSVRGMGRRVMVVVRAPNGKIGWKAIAEASGGVSMTERDEKMNYTPTIGFVEPAPDGESEHEGREPNDLEKEDIERPPQVALYVEYGPPYVVLDRVALGDVGGACVDVVDGPGT